MVKTTRFRPSIYGILMQRGRVLVATSVGKGKDTFSNCPGGAIELGEAPGDALRREFIEETGLAIEPVRLLHVSMQFHRSVVKPKRQMIGAYWLVRKLGGSLVNGNGHDVVALRWVPLGDLTKCDFTSFDVEALQPIQQALRK